MRGRRYSLVYSFEERKMKEYGFHRCLREMKIFVKEPLFDCVLRLYHFVAQALSTPLRDW